MFTKNEMKFLEQKDAKNYGLYFWRLYNEKKATLFVLKKEHLVNNFPENTKIKNIITK